MEAKRPDTFQKEWPLTPMGDQPAAIRRLVDGLQNGVAEQVLLGVTGSGKTFTIANVVAETQMPALVMAPNKTLAAQLFQEFKELFPKNAIEFFISYYDYYQPEAYIPSTDTFIDKDSAINEDIDKMRHSATRALLERNDVIIVSSVSCIYGLGNPQAYLNGMVFVEQGAQIARDDLLRQLVAIQYVRNDISLERGKFRVRGDVVEVVPAHERDRAIRIEFFGREIERVSLVDTLRGTVIEEVRKIGIYPKSHHVPNQAGMDDIIAQITRDLKTQVDEFRAQGKFLEASRVESRTLHDIDMLRELGYCQGIENYSRYLDGRKVGDPPPTLLDYFPRPFLLVLDESHVTVPQIGGMYRGDRARKETLVNYGFRLPAALDNRPLNFDEFLARMSMSIYVSATPSKFELERCGGQYVEQLIRPTGLVDPIITVKPAKHQVDDLLDEVKKTVAQGARVLITTLTKHMAEELTRYYSELGLRIKYLHSDIDSIERVQILRDLRIGIFDVLVGINLLREGLDLPEVELVAILDADKEGFLRSRTSLIQTVGRAARNSNGHVIMYADKVTESMRACLEETERRRNKQIAYNLEHGITPQSVQKKIPEELKKLYNLDFGDEFQEGLEDSLNFLPDPSIARDPKKLDKEIKKLTKQMQKAAESLEFEVAADIRDQINKLRNHALQLASRPLAEAASS